MLEDWAESIADDDLGSLMAALDTTPWPDIDGVFVRRAEAGGAMYTRLHSLPAPGDDDDDSPHCHGGPNHPDGARHGPWRYQEVGPTFSDLYRYHTGAMLVGRHQEASRGDHIGHDGDDCDDEDCSSHDEDDQDADHDGGHGGPPHTGRPSSKRPRS